jgi:hypothetical protein
LASALVFIVGEIGLDETVEFVHLRPCVGSVVSQIAFVIFFVGENILKTAGGLIRIIFIAVTSL